MSPGLGTCGVTDGGHRTRQSGHVLQRQTKIPRNLLKIPKTSEGHPHVADRPAPNLAPQPRSGATGDLPVSQQTCGDTSGLRESTVYLPCPAIVTKQTPMSRYGP